MVTVTHRTAQRQGAWATVYGRRLVITDALALIWVTFGVQIAWFGFDRRTVAGSPADLALGYTAVSVFIVVAWMIVLALYDTRDPRYIGSGAGEYRRVVDSAIRLFAFVAIVAYAFKFDIARGYVFIAFPTGVLVLLLTRWMWRQWLNAQRRNGRYSAQVVLVGSLTSVEHLARELSRHPEEGYRVVGACVPIGENGTTLPLSGIPVLGPIADAVRALRAAGADTVAVTSSDDLGAQAVRELSWELEGGREHLIVAPSLTEINGPRIHTRPVAGLPLIHVEMPRYDGRTVLVKRAFDLVGSAVLIVALSPLLIVLALVVKLTSQGPVLYRQERVGQNGAPFNMLKFRSMRVNADDELAALLAEQGRGDTPLFKLENDPRITPIGRVLRKHSLDEFPQLFNVLFGTMSLVGPRPQREGEVALYDAAARRRLLLKPGMSGLWQVGGRSSLGWEDAIRLDLYYVENWSLTGDLLILWKTVRAVLAPGESAH
ncbi:sugar transferase [Curtobacterium sp. MCBD17_030]|uniref:sugar transferase n=1 Tax=Curtobacterium sp. MCBD17_030 TaxID=2175649 RepID=UPI000D8ACCF4|nr:sugar transferase [Curtobacterium sp. MCBD17_030]PYY31834.1 sugar transferase [Curtobacterium sp. MCBD17_030]